MAANETFIPVFLVGWVQMIVPGECFDEFFYKLNFLHVPCLKIAISKCLGYAIIIGSSVVKLPQVVKMFQAKSGEGISLPSVTLELIAISTSWAYSVGYEYPFSTYGEAVFMAIQTIAIAVMVLLFNGRTAHGVAYVSIYVGAMAYLLSPAVSKQVLQAGQAGNVLLVIASKLLQIFANVKNGSTGQLSMITVTLLWLGAIARVFTSMQETGDKMVMASYVISSVMNGVILGQIFYYAKASQSQQVNRDSPAEGKKLSEPLLLIASLKSSSQIFSKNDYGDDIRETKSSPQLLFSLKPDRCAYRI